MSFKKLRLNYDGGKHTLPIWARKLVEAGQLGANEVYGNSCLNIIISLPAISYASSFTAMGVIAECLRSSNKNNDDEQTNDIDYWRSKIGQTCQYNKNTGNRNGTVAIQALIEGIEKIDGEKLLKIKINQKNKGTVRTTWEFISPDEASVRIQSTDSKAKVGTKISNNASHNAAFAKEVYGRFRFEKLKSNKNVSLSLVDSKNRFRKETEQRFLFANNRIGCLADLILPSNTYRHRHSKTCKFFCSTKSLDGKIVDSDFLILSGSNSIIRANTLNAKCVFYLLSKTERNFEPAKEVILDRYFNRNIQMTGPKLDPEKYFEILTFYT